MRVRVGSGSYSGSTIDGLDLVEVVGRRGHEILGDVEISNSGNVVLRGLRLPGGGSIVGAGGDGVQCLEGGSNVFERNLVRRVNDGFDIKVDCPDNRIHRNRVRLVDSDGIDVESDSNEITDNRIRTTDNVGIELNGSANVVTGNRIGRSGEEPIRDDVGGNDIRDNRCPGQPACV